MNPTLLSPSIKEAYGQCQKLVFGPYENFPVASLLLPKAVRPHIAALYAFARAADDFADEEKYEGRRIQELNRWEKCFLGALQGKSAPPFLQAFAQTVKTYDIPLHLPLNLLKAYRMDLTIKRYATWKDLLYYCGTVPIPSAAWSY